MPVSSSRPIDADEHHAGDDQVVAVARVAGVHDQEARARS